MKIDYTKWKTKEGKELIISEMETSHIKNCIILLEKDIFRCDEIINACEDFDDDSYSCYFELSEAIESKKHFKKYIEVFTKELNKRGEK